MRLIHVCETLSAAAGGPPVYVTGLCTALAHLGHEVHLCTPDSGIRPEAPLHTDAVHVHRVAARAFSHGRITICPGFRRLLKHLSPRADLIHTHGIWAPVCYNAAKVAKRARTPHVISPHGMLHASALRRSAWKKAIAWRLGVRRHLREAACFGALTADEVVGIRKRGLTSPVAVLPSAVEIGQFDSLPAPAEAEHRWPELANRRVALFLGRVHPIKGLEHLLRAWAQLPERLRDWRLVIAGPDEVKWRATLEALLIELGAAERVVWTGFVHGAEKYALLSKADAFVLPSFSEGQSCSLLESSAARLPAVVSPGSALDGLLAFGGAIQAPPEADAWADALTRLLDLSDDARHAMGQRARDLVEQRYAWPAVAGQMADVYEWLLAQADRPACIDLD